MIDPDDPPRLRDTQGSALGEVLRAAERDVGSPQQLARLAARLGPALAPPVVVTSAAGWGVATKVGLGVVGALVVGAGVWLGAARPAPAPAAAPSAAVVSVSAAPSSAGPAEFAAPPSSTPTPDLVPAPEVAPVAPKPAEKPVAAVQLSEAELLEQARAALHGDPARALARANSHAARYPGGALVQEREVIAIKALRQLGRSAEADRRAAAFAKAFPGSAFARKLQAPP